MFSVKVSISRHVRDIKDKIGAPTIISLRHYLSEEGGGETKILLPKWLCRNTHMYTLHAQAVCATTYMCITIRPYGYSSIPTL